MIKKLSIPLLLLTSLFALGQSNTEVYLFDLEWENGIPTLSNPKNISNNQGYDNQPSFWDDDTVLFSSTRAGQTDIKQFNITQGSTSKWITNTPTGSEYSPLRIPGSNSISAIRLDLDGLQRLYEYDVETGDSEPLSDLKIGYHVWFNDDILVSSVLVEDRLDLVVSNFKNGSNYTYQKNVGRSLHKIPGTDLISFISKEDKDWKIKSMNPVSGATSEIAATLDKEEDIVWLDERMLVTGLGKTLYSFNTQNGVSWEPIISFQEDEINNISRIAVNKSRTRLAFVAEESPKNVVQKQVETFNNRDLEGFLACYSENVLATRFPNDTMYLGKEKMLDSYERFFQNTKKTSVEVVKRIVLRNHVIDEEETFVDGREGHQVAIYKVENGFIQTMSFIFPTNPTNDTEAVVQKQLEAYNARDIDAFMDTYSDEITLLNYPNNLISKGKEKMHERYASFFEKTPNLHCEIKNRIVIGNKVIDEEYVTVNERYISAVAIYEVENGKIAKVTFIQ